MATPPEPAAVERVLEEWAIVWSGHDVERFAALFTDDVVYEDVTLGVVNRGQEALRRFAAGVFAATPDFALALTSRFAAGEWAALEWRWTGTRAAMPDLPATSTPFSLRGCAILELRGGKIRRNSDYWDLATFLRQVGLPAP